MQRCFQSKAQPLLTPRLFFAYISCLGRLRRSCRDTPLGPKIACLLATCLLTRLNLPVLLCWLLLASSKLWTIRDFPSFQSGGKHGNVGQSQQCLAPATAEGGLPWVACPWFSQPSSMPRVVVRGSCIGPCWAQCFHLLCPHCVSGRKIRFEAPSLQHSFQCFRIFCVTAVDCEFVVGRVDHWHCVSARQT